MEICIKYKDGTIDKLSTDSLTESGAINNAGKSNIMTKFRINWREFTSGTTPMHLNLYIYYYQKNNDRCSKINNRAYLDNLIFYENDQKIGANWTKEQIDEKEKALPYGLMEPGSWFTIIPLELKDEVLEVTQDDRVMLIRLFEHNELIDVSLLDYYESQLNIEPENNNDYKLRILSLYEKLIEQNNTSVEKLSHYEIISIIGNPEHLLNKIIINNNKNCYLETLYK